jgi:hypothetical protein
MTKKIIWTDDMLFNLGKIPLAEFQGKYKIGHDVICRKRNELGITTRGLFSRNQHIYINNIESKLCGKCEKTLSLLEFGKMKKCWDGLDWDCLNCQRIRNKKRNKQETTKKYQREYKQRRRNESPVLKLCFNIRRGITRFIRQRGKIKKSKFTDYLGCSVDEFTKYIESRLTYEMTWENYGKVWHLDHIIPLRFFNLNNIYRAWHYTNLQPLLAEENLRKNDLLPNGNRARNIK